jgi:hypothetical protein
VYVRFYSVIIHTYSYVHLNAGLRFGGAGS